MLVLTQVTLGAFVIWSEKNVAINTAHVVVGALTLATSLVLTLRTLSRAVWRCAPRWPSAYARRSPRISDAPGPTREKGVGCGHRRRRWKEALDCAAERSHPAGSRFPRAHQTPPELPRRRNGRHRVLPRGGIAGWMSRGSPKRSSASRWSPGAPRGSIRFTSARPTASCGGRACVRWRHSGSPPARR